MNKTILAVLAAFCAGSAAQAQMTASTLPATADTVPHAYIGLGVGMARDTAAGGNRAMPRSLAATSSSGIGAAKPASRAFAQPTSTTGMESARLGRRRPGEELSQLRRQQVHRSG